MAIEWWIVGATILGPVIAVQTQKFIERATDTALGPRAHRDVDIRAVAEQQRDPLVTQLGQARFIGRPQQIF